MAKNRTGRTVAHNLTCRLSVQSTNPAFAVLLKQNSARTMRCYHQSHSHNLNLTFFFKKKGPHVNHNETIAVTITDQKTQKYPEQKRWGHWTPTNRRGASSAVEARRYRARGEEPGGRGGGLGLAEAPRHAAAPHLADRGRPPLGPRSRVDEDGLEEGGRLRHGGGRPPGEARPGGG